VQLQPLDQGGRFRPVGTTDVQDRRSAACGFDEAAIAGFADQRVTAGEQVAETHRQCFENDRIGMLDLPASLAQPAHAVYPRPSSMAGAGYAARLTSINLSVSISSGGGRVHRACRCRRQRWVRRRRDWADAPSPCGAWCAEKHLRWHSRHVSAQRCCRHRNSGDRCRNQFSEHSAHSRCRVLRASQRQVSDVENTMSASSSRSRRASSATRISSLHAGRDRPRSSRRRAHPAPRTSACDVALAGQMGEWCMMRERRWASGTLERTVRRSCGMR